MTLVISPAIFIDARNFPKVPSTTFRSIITTLESLCSPTAARVPFLFKENWRGKDPPAGASCTNVSFPVDESMAHDCKVSEGIFVLFLGSKFRILNNGALREDVKKNFPSGFRRNQKSSLQEGGE